MDLPYNVSDFAFPSRWDSDSGPSVVERAGRPEIADRTRTQSARDKDSDCGASRGSDRSRTIYRGREREYSLRDSEVRTLADVGRFRVVPTEDLARFGYQGDQARMEADLRNLRKHGLVEQRMIEGHSSYSTKVLTLTKEGHRLLKHAQIYTHSVPESKRRAVANVAALLFPSVPPQEGQQEQRQESIN